jgi:RF-1 domain
MHPAALPVETLLADCELRRTRRSGPGGQHRNKVETAVVIEHRPSGVSAEGSERRSLEQNRQQAIFRLRVKLALAVRRPAPEERAPCALWRSRCRRGTIAVHEEHDDFPAILAEALDFVSAEKMDVRAAAGRLGCTSSQLTKLLQQGPHAMTLVNQERVKLGLRRLK